MPPRRSRPRTLDEAFGLVVAQLRTERGLSAERLGNQADVDPSYVRLLEKGNRSASIKTLSKLGAAFGLAPWELLRRAQDLLGST